MKERRRQLVAIDLRGRTCRVTLPRVAQDIAALKILVGARLKKRNIFGKRLRVIAHMQARQEGGNVARDRPIIIVADPADAEFDELLV